MKQIFVPILISVRKAFKFLHFCKKFRRLSNVVSGHVKNKIVKTGGYCSRIVGISRTKRKNLELVFKIISVFN